jgi:UDP-N-acetylmuramate--alanine ligase
MNNLRHISNFRIKHLHFIGIGGSGMSGIAEVLHNLGYRLSGSDLNQSPITERLQKLGCAICTTNHQENIKNDNAVVVSSAISEKR